MSLGLLIFDPSTSKELIVLNELFFTDALGQKYNR